MSRKIIGISIGGLIGALIFGACAYFISDSWRMIGVTVGLVLGGISGFAFVMGQLHMAKDRETGLDG